MTQLWNFPWNLPPADADGNLDSDIVGIMERQAASIGTQAPQYAEAQFELMRAYGLAGRLDDARKVLEGLLALDAPADAKARALVVTGAYAERVENFVVAVELYSKAVDLDPQSYFGYNNLAYSLSRLGRHDAAEMAARAAIAIDPGVYNAHKNLGVALENLNRFAEAARAYLAAVQAYPFDKRAYRHLQEVVERHPEVLREVEGLAEEIEYSSLPNVLKRMMREHENGPTA